MDEAHDTRFLALRHAGQDATDFALTDDAVRRFISLRDAGADEGRIAAELGEPPEVVTALVRADEAQALAHRIAIGEEPAYPVLEPGEAAVDTRAGSAWVPIAVLMTALAGAIVYALVR